MGVRDRIGARLRRRPIRWASTEARAGWTSYRDGTCWARSSAIGTGLTLVLERVPGARHDEANYAAHPVQSHGHFFAAIEPPPREKRINGTVFTLTGNGSFNYYHWLIELLPRARSLPDALSEHPSLVVAAPSSVRDTPQMARALELAIGADTPVVWVDDDETLSADLLLVPRQLSVCVFNKREGTSYEDRDFHVDAGSLTWWSSLLAAAAQDVTSPAGRRIYLSRGEGNRSYNEAEVFALFAPYGFESVDTKLLSLEQQVALFASAEALAGPTGAAWTNILFCKPRTQMFYFRPKEYGDFRAFEKLALLRDAKFHSFTFPTGAPTMASLYRRPYTVPAEGVHDAFSGSLRALS